MLNGEYILSKLIFTVKICDIFRNISGVVKCMQEPIPNMYVRLLTPNMWLWWKEASVVRTRLDGSFSLPDIPDAFALKDIQAMVLRIDYQYDAGPHRFFIIANYKDHNLQKILPSEKFQLLMT